MQTDTHIHKIKDKKKPTTSAAAKVAAAVEKERAKFAIKSI